MTKLFTRMHKLGSVSDLIQLIYGKEQNICQHGLWDVLSQCANFCLEWPKFPCSPPFVCCVVRGWSFHFLVGSMRLLVCIRLAVENSRLAGRPGSLKAKPVRSLWPADAGDTAPRGRIGSPATFCARSPDVCLRGFPLWNPGKQESRGEVSFRSVPRSSSGLLIEGTFYTDLFESDWCLKTQTTRPKKKVSCCDVTW